jgi:hypothetical protein
MENQKNLNNLGFPGQSSSKRFEIISKKAKMQTLCNEHSTLY